MEKQCKAGPVVGSEEDVRRVEDEIERLQAEFDALGSRIENLRLKAMRSSAESALFGEGHFDNQKAEHEAAIRASRARDDELIRQINLPDQVYSNYRKDIGRELAAMAQEEARQQEKDRRKKEKEQHREEKEQRREEMVRLQTLINEYKTAEDAALANIQNYERRSRKLREQQRNIFRDNQVHPAGENRERFRKEVDEEDVSLIRLNNF